jgi:hypothetical protein
MVFQYGTNAAGQPVLYATDASLTVDPNGGPPTEIFNFGLFQGVSTTVTGLLFTQFVVTHPNVPGSFGLGPNGTVEVDVPLADITTTGGTPPPSIGATLTGTQGYTASGQGNQGAGNEFISDADPNAVTGDPTGTFGHNYTLGQTTCIDSGTVVTPEAPLTVGLLLAGGVAVSGLAVVARRRRAARIRPAA